MCIACVRKSKHKPHNACGIEKFQVSLLEWYEKNKRDELPWRWTNKRPVSPYHILVSEIMLQQTQVSRVLDKFPKFIAAFPAIGDIARASLSEVLNEWQGMGYNRRGLYLKQCAEELMERFNGEMPSERSVLAALPGIGPYTSGAISCFGFNTPEIFLDTNIRKFFLHYFFKNANKKISDKEISPIAERLLYRENPRLWNYALMDYGALVLSRKSELLSRAKNYRKQSPFFGSNRFFRSQIVQYLLKRKKVSLEELQKISPRNIRPLLDALCKERLIREIRSDIYSING